MRKASVRSLGQTALAVALVLASTCLFAAGDRSSVVSFVPWKVLDAGDEPIHTALVLVWIPASRDDVRHSELLTSRALTLYAAQCVGMQLIRPDDFDSIDRFNAAGTLPTAILTTSDGRPLARVDGQRGELRASDVERMVRDELRAREAAVESLLDDALEQLAHGSRDAAIDDYRHVWEQRCLFPREAHDAQRALKKLGVVVTE